MSNVLPIKEQKRVWATYRQRFISLASWAASVVALIAIATLAPSYILLMLNRPEPPTLKGPSVEADERREATKTQTLVAALLPAVAATSSAIEAITKALEGRPDGISVNRITYSGEKQKTIILGGMAQSRENINAFRKTLEAKGIYQSVSVPVGDLIGATGNQFTITLVTNP